MRYLEKIVNCYPQSNVSDGIEQLASLFLVLYLILCSQWSASSNSWCSSGYCWFFIYIFLLLNQEHGVNNEHSQLIQSVHHSTQTHCMWPGQKDCGTRKKKKKKVFLAHSSHLAVQYSTGPCLKVWCCHRPALFDWRFHSEIMDL